MHILELRKVPIYESHYNYIKNKYGNKSRLLVTHTHSLVYEIETEHVYESFSTNKETFNFSNYPAKSIFHDSTALVAGRMKNEMGDVDIKGFVGLKPKMYSILVNIKNSW